MPEKNNTEKDNLKKDKEKKERGEKHIHIHISAIAVIVIVLVVLFLVGRSKKSGGLGSLFHNKEGEVTTVTESELTDVVKEHNLYTAEYPYNSYVTVCDDDGNTEYYVAYNGTVKAGLDVNGIDISLDEENSRITIRLPQVSVMDVTVDSASLDYIFMSDKYNSETVSSEAFTAASSDLRTKADQDTEITEVATDNAKKIVRGLVEPWVNQVSPDKTYDVQVLAYGEKQ